MKKLLVVLLAVVMVFGFAATAMAADTLATAYPDLSGKDTTVQDAFMKLSALNVFGGYPDGTIQPDATITRAEFAKVACQIYGMSDSADVLKGNASKFSDVPANQWYTGYVNLATSQGLVSGYPDGTFKPNNNITMQEVLTVLMRVAGYNDNLVGPWPMNYIAQGGKLDVTDDVAFAGAAPATRASVAVMASNILGLDVVYWDNDKSKFVEDTKTIRVWDEDDDEWDNVEFNISVLENKFDAATVNDVTIDSYDWWEFDDFEDQELSLYYASWEDEWGDSSEMAETYWVSDGKAIDTIDTMQADLILNDDNEVVYIDITSTNAYSDDVTITASGEEGNTLESIEVNGKKVKIADIVVIPASVDEAGEFDFTAKIHYNADNEVYFVQDVSGLGDVSTVYIFETYNETKNRIEPYNTEVVGNINLKDKDVAILKNGQFITPADLKDGDVLHVFDYDTPNNADIVIEVLPFFEGELTKGTATKLTIGGSAMVFGDGIYSSDAMDTFADIAGPDSVDDAYGTTVKYVFALLNPYDLRVMVFEGGASNTIYGIITDVSANIDGQVSGITVLGADGEEVDYDLVKDNDPRPDYISYWINGGDLGMGESGYTYTTNDLTFGTYVEAKVSEDGTISTDDIKKLADPVYASWTGDNDFDGLTDTASTINNSRIQIGTTYYTLNDDTLVFETTITDNAFDEANVVDVADLIAADDVSGAGILAFVDGGVVEQLFLLNSDLTSTDYFGVLDNTEYYSGDWHAIFLDGSDYTFDASYASTVSAMCDKVFTQYEVGSGDITDYNTFVEIQDYDSEDDEIDDIWFRTVQWELDNHVDYMGGRVEVNGLDAMDVSVSTSNNIITIEGDNYLVDDDTKYYVVDGGEITEGDIYDYDDGDQIWAYTDVEGEDDMILEFVFIFHDEID